MSRYASYCAGWRDDNRNTHDRNYQRTAVFCSSRSLSIGPAHHSRTGREVAAGGSATDALSDSAPSAPVVASCLSSRCTSHNESSVCRNSIVSLTRLVKIHGRILSFTDGFIPVFPASRSIQLPPR
ncbi:hypothetical protein EVAR_101250_1 [Eumeta japonica]|uniref:Uncharacterized protein n=1 Tax=Eumeta variegata TaxID=151549 RepID=A0A4C1SMX5_EUMVA|nr:hypothetical protein EVAR_101250_1 [Eumeta japonica]